MRGTILAKSTAILAVTAITATLASGVIGGIFERASDGLEDMGEGAVGGLRSVEKVSLDASWDFCHRY